MNVGKRISFSSSLAAMLRRNEKTIKFLLDFFLKPKCIRWSLFLSLLFHSCTDSKKSEECLFLENIMIRNGGLYVLMGSKPMVDFPIDSGYPETDEKCKEDYLEYLNGLKKENRKCQALDYESYRAMCKQSIYNHHHQLWNSWERAMGQYVGPCFRFVALKHISAVQNKTGLFINIPNTLLVLEEYYNEFEKVAGGPFDPREVIDEISDENSHFWNKIFHSNSYIIGLLLGYGKRNSFIFAWEQKNNLLLPRFSDMENKITTQIKRNITVADLALPEFCIFSLGEQVMENYKQEQKEIIKEFSGKDFESTVKQWLARGQKSPIPFKKAEWKPSVGILYRSIKSLKQE